MDKESDVLIICLTMGKKWMATINYDNIGPIKKSSQLPLRMKFTTYFIG